MLVVWGALVGAPLILMALLLTGVKRETARNQIIAVFGAIAIVGYGLATVYSFAAMAYFSHWSIL